MYSLEDLEQGAFSEREHATFLFWRWVSSLIIVFSSSSRLPKNFIFFLYNYIVFLSVDAPHFIIHSLIEGLLSCFHFLTIRNRAATNVGQQASVK